MRSAVCLCAHVGIGVEEGAHRDKNCQFEQADVQLVEGRILPHREGVEHLGWQYQVGSCCLRAGHSWSGPIKAIFRMHAPACYASLLPQEQPQIIGQADRQSACSHISPPNEHAPSKGIKLQSRESAFFGAQRAGLRHRCSAKTLDHCSKRAKGLSPATSRLSDRKLTQSQQRLHTAVPKLPSLATNIKAYARRRAAPHLKWLAARPTRRIATSAAAHPSSPAAIQSCTRLPFATTSSVVKAVPLTPCLGVLGALGVLGGLARPHSAREYIRGLDGLVGAWRRRWKLEITNKDRAWRSPGPKAAHFRSPIPVEQEESAQTYGRLVTAGKKTPGLGRCGISNRSPKRDR